jgi:hypothetical protein
VIDISPKGEITFEVDGGENLGVIKPENLADRGGNYRVGNRIKALCIRVEPEDNSFIFYCTLNFSKDRR